MPVLGTPNTKCPHGIFLAGEATARYCSFCNPASAFGISGGQGEPIEMPEEGGEPIELDDTDLEGRLATGCDFPS